MALRGCRADDAEAGVDANADAGEAPVIGGLCIEVVACGPVGLCRVGAGAEGAGADNVALALQGALDRGTGVGAPADAAGADVVDSVCVVVVAGRAVGLSEACEARAEDAAVGLMARVWGRALDVQARVCGCGWGHCGCCGCCGAPGADAVVLARVVQGAGVAVVARRPVGKGQAGEARAEAALACLVARVACGAGDSCAGVDTHAHAIRADVARRGGVSVVARGAIWRALEDAEAVDARAGLLADRRGGAGDAGAPGLLVDPADGGDSAARFVEGRVDKEGRRGPL